MVSRVIRARHEKGVLIPLEPLDFKEGEVLLLKVLGRDVAEKVFGSIKVDKKTLERVLREAEDEFGFIDSKCNNKVFYR